MYALYEKALLLMKPVRFVYDTLLYQKTKEKTIDNLFF